MQTREEYIESLKKQNNKSGRSEPKYKCPHCGGDVRKVLSTGSAIYVYSIGSTIPQVRTDFLYECDNCNYNEHISE